MPTTAAADPTATKPPACPAGFECIAEPPGCPAGLACVPTRDYALLSVSQLHYLDTKIATYQAQLERLRLARQRRIGWAVGCGGGVGWDPLRNSADLEPFCGGLFGWRF